MTGKSIPLAAAVTLALVALLGVFAVRGSAVVVWHAVLVAGSGLVVGSLGLLMIGHLMREDWLMPIRSEAEGAALTAPLLVALALPLAFALDRLFPWAGAGTLSLPRGRAFYLQEPFFLARAAACLLAWTALAFWVARAKNLRRASAIGLAVLAPTCVVAANDWVLSRDPLGWSSLFGFAFAASQLLAALAGAILITLLRPEHPSAKRMQSLERALLTLALLAPWIWFAQFLIVWLANLPHEAAWYLARSGAWLWLLAGVAIPSLLVAVVILVPPGFTRRTMILGSALLLVHHVAHMAWILGPAIRGTSWAGLLLALALAGLWGGWFTVLLRGRPAFAAEAEGDRR